MLRSVLGILLLVLILSSCKGKNEDSKPTSKNTETETNTAEKEETGWEDVMSSVVVLNSYDGDRILEKGQGFFVAPNLIVTKYSLVSNATKVVYSPIGSDKNFVTTKFTAVDRINDLVLLHTDTVERKPIELFMNTPPTSAKTFYISPSSEKTIQLFTGKFLNLSTIKGTKQYRVTNVVRNSAFGMPLFVSTKKAIGLAYSATIEYETQNLVIPANFIADLINNNDNKPTNLELLRSNTNEAVAAENRKIKGLVLETDEGNITIRLFDETPEYRDNFIKLAKEGYYDSLLIHRVIKNFGIQMGAADTRYAEKGDIIGFKGPGYTIPSHIVPGLFHKRGMIGSPRKPDTRNQRRRSDGSQFYIVSGRTYTDAGLDELEKLNDYKFSAEQRQVYKTIGGAPHLDGTYTVFGEVISGMDIVDKIVQVETDDDWRPLEDIRLRKITILK